MNNFENDKNQEKQESTTKERISDIMPTVENVNYDVISYIKQIEDYIADFKKLSPGDAKKQAKENLVNTGIIDKEGKLTGYYKK